MNSESKTRSRSRAGGIGLLGLCLDELRVVRCGIVQENSIVCGRIEATHTFNHHPAIIASCLMVEISTPMNINHKSMMLDDGSKPCSRTTLLELLSALKIEHKTVSHEAMFTVAQSKSLRETDPHGG